MTTAGGGVPTFPFFVGCGRSGTTLVRAMFDSHPDMAVVYESSFVSTLVRQRRRYERPEGFDRTRFLADLTTHFAFDTLGTSAPDVARALEDDPPQTTADAIRRVYGDYARRQGKHRYADKTPMYVNVVPVLADAFPEARFVHIVRDGRNVALAYMSVPWGPMRVVDATLYWKRNVERGRRAGHRLGPGRYREVTYERLVHEPEQVLAELCPFLGLDFDPAMLRYFDRADQVLASIDNPQHHRGLSMPVTKGMRDWRTGMDSRDVCAFELLAGKVLTGMGYERSAEQPSLRLRASVHAGRTRVEAGRLAHRLGKEVQRAVQAIHGDRSRSSQRASARLSSAMWSTRRLRRPGSRGG